VLILGSSSSKAQSAFLADESNGTLITANYCRFAESAKSASGFGVTFGRSFRGRFDAGASFTSFDGISPSTNGDRIFSPYVAFYIIKQSRETQTPFSLKWTGVFDLTIPRGGTQRNDWREDPGRVFTLGMELSHVFGTTKNRIQPTAGFAWKKPLAEGYEAEIFGVFGMAFRFGGEGNIHGLIHPQFSFHGEENYFTMAFGVIW
jgi:hypothetical protein